MADPQLTSGISFICSLLNKGTPLVVDKIMAGGSKSDGGEGGGDLGV
jgi:hypothetical protein